ncbi:MAG TPA: AMP-binding protein [Acidimicrobiales bacterium]|nr:AMP-binding protein [Acidimicrobiales bacterium]
MSATDGSGSADPTAMTGLGEAFDRLAGDDPDAPAVTFRGATITRRDLAARSNRLARRLAAAGAGPGSTVTIGLPNGPAFYEAALAAWKLGAVPQPVSYRLPPAELDALIDVADPAVVVGLDPGSGRPWVDPGQDLDDFDDSPLAPAVSPSWKAMTSGGSTGRPKLIVTTTPAVAGFVTAAGPLLHLGERETFLCTGPLYHNGPFLFSMTALFLGGHIVVMDRFDAARSLEMVERHRVTYMYLVPTMMSRILRLPEAERVGRDMSSLRTAYHLAAPCPPHVKQAWIDWLGPDVIVELYAGTEGQAATVITGGEWLAHPGSVGRVMMGEMKVCDTDGRDLPPGEVGEIWMRPSGERPTYRYVGASARTRDGWDSLGDMGWFDQDGYLYLTDRQTDMILVGGANVYPAEVEAALDEHPAVLSSCVIGLPDEDYGNVVHAIVELSGDVSDQDLRDFLSSRLVAYKLPRSFERSAEPLRDDAGKVRRGALRAARLPAR